MSIEEPPRSAEQARAHIRPRARIMRTLGDELISSELVAVIELVKNAYDADATRVLVRFRAPLEPGAGGIDVIDDGHGMSVETVLGAFLEPATAFRRQSRLSEEFQRPVTGEKGIGRFAVSRLADELELVSRRPDAPTETRVLFDWSLFDDEGAYLDEVPLAWEEATPVDIAPGGIVDALWPEPEPPRPERLRRGTALRMAGLRTHWGEEDLQALRNGLARLVSPFLFEEQRERPDGFSIRLDLPPQFQHLSGVVEPPEALRNPHYSLRGQIAADGTYSIEMRLRGETEARSRSGRVQLDGRAPACGPFDLELRVWDRDQLSMAELAGRHGSSAGQVRQDLDRAAGVNVYRDGFRVLPYGERGNDWLNLDARRVQNPTLRLSNNQIVGYVLVSSAANPGLRDQTNREGLLQNQAFDDFRASLREIIGQLESARYAVRPRREAPRRPGAGSLFAGFDLAAVREYTTERYPADSRLRGLLGEAEQGLEQRVERAEEVVGRYRRLATLGQLIDKVLHDGRAPLAKIGNDALIGLRDLTRRELPCEDLLDGMRQRLSRVQRQHDVLATVFRRIEPFGGRRRGRPSSVVLEEVIQDAFGVLESDVHAAGAAVELPSSRTSVTVDQAELQEILINLLDNSLYWLGSVPKEERKIRVGVDRDADGVHILFSDSGPGVRPEDREHIFDPYYSSKRDGIGLGLNIAGEIVDEYYGGELKLLDTGPLRGANFKVTLRRRV